MPFKDKAKRRKYNREFMRRKRASGEYTTPYKAWVKEQLAKNPSANVSFAEFFRHVEMEKLIKKRYAEADKAWNPQKQTEPLKGCGIWHEEPSTSKLCSLCGLPFEEGDSPDSKLCGECFIKENA